MNGTATRAPLYGLVLAGGYSRRMRQDKATLPYAGRSQLARAVDLLTPRVERCWVSVRPDQSAEAQRASYPLIVDLQPDLGPLGGIQAALHAHSDRAWLVLACDLPFLTDASLDHLIAQRDSTRMATAYRSSHDGLPEPLCAIYEPICREAVDRWIEQGQRCPRSLLGRLDTLLLEPIDARALENINTPEEYATASSQLHPGASALSSGLHRMDEPTASCSRGVRLTVRYFALLREQAGRDREEILTQATTPLALYQELRHRRSLGLAPELLRVAINEEFGDWQAPLSNGDTVAFLPPVAGG